MLKRAPQGTAHQPCVRERACHSNHWYSKQEEWARRAGPDASSLNRCVNWHALRRAKRHYQDLPPALVSAGPIKMASKIELRCMSPSDTTASTIPPSHSTKGRVHCHHTAAHNTVVEIYLCTTTVSCCTFQKPGMRSTSEMRARNTSGKNLWGSGLGYERFPKSRKKNTQFELLYLARIDELGSFIKLNWICRFESSTTVHTNVTSFEVAVGGYDFGSWSWRLRCIPTRQTFL